jgi:hypothetical protein
VLEALIGPVTGLLDKFIEDKDQKARLAHEIATMAEKYAHENALAQIEVNKTEAASRNPFVAGWRPFIGWTCGIAMFIATWAGADLPELPHFDMDNLMTVLLGMLGLGGLRTFEKVKSVTR